MTAYGKDKNLKRTVLITFGTVLGLFFFYLAFRGISLRELISGVLEVRLAYLIPAAFLIGLIQLLRAFRFGLIIAPFSSVGFKDLWDLTNIWGALNMVIPARLAEFVKPYLLRQCGAPFSSGFGAVLVERFFDLLALLTLLAVVLWNTPQIPAALAFLGKLMPACLAAAYLMVLVILTRREKVQSIVQKLLGILPRRAASFLGGAFSRLIDGLGIMASAKQAALIFACSLAVWTLFACLTYLLLLAFDIRVQFLVAVTIQVVLCIGVALPSAPGFIGTFHAAGRYALELFGVTAVPAISFATVYHFFSLLACLALGSVSYRYGRFRFGRGLFPDEGREEPSAARSLPEATNVR